MSYPRYTICKKISSPQQGYQVCKGRKVLSIHATKELAEIECQRLVEDDNWYAANRD